MFKTSFAGKHIRALAIAAGLVAASERAISADLSLPLTGNLLGSVLDGSGTPQVGATVQLFNKYQRPIGKAVTALDGRFAFAGLPADLYAIRVSLPSFFPASRDKIAVHAGVDSILQIHLATLLSSIEVHYALPTAGMMDDWKWVLRSSPATRPVTRILPEPPAQASNSRPSVFSGTHAMFSVSGGDTGVVDIDSENGDLGTQFAVSTTVFGNNQIQIGGTFASYPGSGPMSLAAVYTRDQIPGLGEAPEFTFSMSQFGIANGESVGTQNGGASTPVRALSVSIYQTADPTANVHVEYGVTGESVEFLQHTSRVSPFARSTVDLGSFGEVVGSYSDGARPDELIAHQQTRPVAEDVAPSDDLATALDALARLPQLCYRGGHLELQRTEDYEVGYRRTARTRTYAVSAFYEDASNARVNVAGDVSALDPEDLLADGISKTPIYNLGNYRRHGTLGSVNQRITNSVNVAVAYGRIGGFTTGANSASLFSAPDQRFLTQGDENFATVDLEARSPIAGTLISANYGWVDHNAIIPQHIFTTQDAYARPGLNIFIRQPLPSFFGVPGRLELTADLRNLLAQGYLPIETGDGRRVLLIQSTRMVRGGVSFIF